VWGTDCGGANCEGVVWGTLARDGDNIVWGTVAQDNIVWGTALSGDNIVWGTVAQDNIVWGTAARDNIVWGTAAGDNIVWGTEPPPTDDTVFDGFFESIVPAPGPEPIISAVAIDGTIGGGL
jgi:hypothetical protein